MSWKARLSSNQYAPPYTPKSKVQVHPKTPKSGAPPTTRNNNSLNDKSKNSRSSTPTSRRKDVKNKSNTGKRPWTTMTTMSGLPWSVRDKLEGKTSSKKSLGSNKSSVRLANYAFSYGLSKSDQEKLKEDILFDTPDMNASAFDENNRSSQLSLNDTISKSKNGIVVAKKLKQIKDSFMSSKELTDKKDSKIIDTTYIRNWDTSAISDEEGSNYPKDVQNDQVLKEHSQILQSTHRILNEAKFDEGLANYFRAFEDMNQSRHSKSSDESIVTVKPSLSSESPQMKPKG